MRESSLLYTDIIVNLWNQGFSLNQISDKITVIGQDTIRKILKSKNIDPRFRKFKKITPNKEIEIIEFYKNGNSIRQTLLSFKISSKVFKRILDQHNIEYIPNNLPFEKQLENLDLDHFKLLLSHGSLNLIYETLGINSDISKRIIEYYNLTFKMKYPKISNLDVKTQENIFFCFYNCMTNNEISQFLDIPPNLIKRFLFKNNKKRNHSPVPEERHEDFLTYTKIVRKLTNYNILHQTLGSKEGYHWNHKFSILDGFRNNVPPDLLSSKNNLELISAYENLSIGWKSKITVDEFKRMVIVF